MTRKERRRQQFADRKPSATATTATAPEPAFDPGDPFARPHDLDDLTAAFGAGRDVFALMPKYSDIPAEFKDWNDRTPFNRIQSEWFFRGLKKWILMPKPGIDHKKALAHLSAIQRSFDPPHEHKSAGVAYLISKWYVAPKGG